MRHTLTDHKVKNAAPQSNRYDLWDALVPGLTLRITPAGAKSWTIVSRLRGKVLRYTLGQYPNMRLAEAREAARTALEAVGAGRDPRTPKGITLSSLWDQYEPLQVQWGKKHRDSVASAFRLYIKPGLGHRPVETITKPELMGWLESIAASKGPTANHLHAYLAAFFGWATERQILSNNPLAGVRRPAYASSRDRVYTDPELRSIWATALGLEWPYGPIIQLLLVTAQRRNQVAGMAWQEIDSDRWVWTSRTKEGRLHPLPLSGLAQDLITKHGRSGVYLFGSRPPSNWDYWTKEFRKGKGVPQDFRLHDLRRTAATRMQELGTKPEVVDAVLDHAAGGVTGVYQRYGYLEEMRLALEGWAVRLRVITA